MTHGQITNMVSVGKGRTAMTQARWELETAAETLAPKPVVAAAPSSQSTTTDQGLFVLEGDTSKATNEVTDDELQLANHEEVLHTSSVRSDAMQKIVKTFLAELRLETSSSAPPAVTN